MAIKNNLVLPNGTQGEYWTITYIGVDVKTLDTTFTLSLFVDEQSFNSGKNSLLTNKKYTFRLTVEELLSPDLFLHAYQRILDKANTMIQPIFPGMGEEERPFDPHLAGGQIL